MINIKELAHNEVIYNVNSLWSFIIRFLFICNINESFKSFLIIIVIYKGMSEATQ